MLHMLGNGKPGNLPPSLWFTVAISAATTATLAILHTQEKEKRHSSPCPVMPPERHTTKLIKQHHAVGVVSFQRCARVSILRTGFFRICCALFKLAKYIFPRRSRYIHQRTAESSARGRNFPSHTTHGGRHGSGPLRQNQTTHQTMVSGKEEDRFANFLEEMVHVRNGNGYRGVVASEACHIIFTSNAYLHIRTSQHTRAEA